jgi:hypothetical protein
LEGEEQQVVKRFKPGAPEQSEEPRTEDFTTQAANLSKLVKQYSPILAT